jgi:hypothetical protein
MPLPIMPFIIGVLIMPGLKHSSVSIHAIITKTSQASLALPVASGMMFLAHRLTRQNIKPRTFDLYQFSFKLCLLA